MSVGFIGLGIMGRPMAANLLRAGHDLVVHSRSRGPVDELVAAGASAASDAADVASRCETVITMLPDDATVEQVAREMRPALRRGALMIDMSTTSPALARRLADDVAPLGAAFLDAPVSGGEGGAIAASLAIMVGGDAPAVERAMPLLRALGATVVHVGGSGTGQVAKACNQLVVLGTIEIVAEALVLGAKAGVDPARLREALLGGFASSRVLEVHGRRMLERDFRPGGRAVLHVKDAEVLRGLSGALGVPIPAFEASAAALERLVSEGGGDLDHAALVTVLERAAGVQIARGSA